MSVARIASRYAKTLLDLSVQENKLERILEDVEFQTTAPWYQKVWRWMRGG